MDIAGEPVAHSPVVAVTVDMSQVDINEREPRSRPVPARWSSANWKWAVGAVMVALLVRLPGTYWGSNFPDGWRTHHPDEWTHLINAEMLIDPSSKPRWDHRYPKGMGAMVAVPMIALRMVYGEMDDPLPSIETIVVAGRIISVLYGTGSIIVLILLGRRLFRDRRVPIVAAWILALGGLHVTQSHFFLSDVAGLFWLLLGLYLLIRELVDDGKGALECLMWASFCFGAAFGMKLVVMGVPSLALITLRRGPRLRRLVHATMFFIVGVVSINFASYTPADLYNTVLGGVADPSAAFDRAAKVLLFVLEVPSVISFPVTILAATSGVMIGWRVLTRVRGDRLACVLLIVVLPALCYLIPLIFTLDNFPRHLVPLIPWCALLAGWGLVKLSDEVRRRGLHSAVLMVPFFTYLALFVCDGERVFIYEPRNEAARWVRKHIAPGAKVWFDSYEGLAGYERVRFPEAGRPPILLVEMMSANHYLSGLSWRDSYPPDYRRIFDGQSQERVDALQNLFRGRSEYREVARFREGYFMPEYVLTDRLLGNRSRNYVSEIVIFKKTPKDP